MKAKVSMLVAMLGLLVVAAPALAAFPGRNGKIAFVRDIPNGKPAEVFAMDPSGLNQGPLTSDGRDSANPAYSADGKRIAFTKDIGQNDNQFEHIWVMNADGSNQTPLTATPNVNEKYPTFSPDGTKIAYQRQETTSAPYFLWVMNADGGNPHRLTTGTVEERSPAWSPDGTKIAFSRGPESGTPDDRRIVVVNSDGTNPQPLTGSDTNPTGDDSPNWSPDGTTIAFSRDYQTNLAGEFIFTMNADGTNKTQRTTLSGTQAGCGADDTMPAFSPDGTQIAFKREIALAGGDCINQRAAAALAPAQAPDNFHIWVMDANGANQTQRTTGNTEDQKPDWQPLSQLTSSASVSSCSRSGRVTVTVSDPSGFKSGPAAAHYRDNSAAEQRKPTIGGVATLTLFSGRHTLEFWGENTVGDQQSPHNSIRVLVDRRRPRITIRSDQHRRVYRVGQRASVTIRAKDSGPSHLRRNPSRRHKRLNTSRPGQFVVKRTAIDRCGNRRSASFRYRVIAAPRRRAVTPHFTG